MRSVVALRSTDSGREAAGSTGVAPLKQDAPLVPVDSAASRALVGVIGILTFLAALCAGAAELVATNSSEWRTAVAREVTIQVKPSSQRNIEADSARAAAVAREATGVSDARVLSRRESERLLEPWLGAGLDLGELPVPRLVLVQLAERGEVDFPALKGRLADEVPTAILDDHHLWLSRLSTMANTLVGLSLGLVALVLVAAGLAAAFATRGAMAGNRDVVGVLHFVGAHDAFIAQEFQRRFFRLGLKGAALGGGVALGFIAFFGALARLWGGNAAGDQIEALFGAFNLGWRGYAGVVAIIGIVAVVTALVSRRSVRRYLWGTV